MATLQAFRLRPGASVDILDQTLLPARERWVSIADYESMCEAIRALRVRGAPLLGTMGAAGMALAATRGLVTVSQLRRAATALTATRPTAVDLGWAVERAFAAATQVRPSEREAVLWRNAEQLAAVRERQDRAIAGHGASLLSGAALTHCNTGTLATGGIGTALGAIRIAWEMGRLERCYATETRPLLQGARLTAWELRKLDIPVTLLPDTAVAALIATGRVTAVITGADRIATNGDTANKIGTYQIALAAHRHGVPFYIAAPSSTIDLACPGGSAIPIEHRDGREVGGFGRQRWAPEGTDAFNPAFDVTPADLITAIITERGVFAPADAGAASG